MTQTQEITGKSPAVLIERKRWLFFALPFTFTKYILSPQKLVVASGLFTSVEEELRLYRVLDITIIRTLGQKIFGLGSIKVISADRTSPELLIKNIHNVRRFKEYLSDYVEQERQNKRIRAGEIIDHGDLF